MPEPQAKPPRNRFLRTFTVALALGLLLFAVLWYTVFSAVTAAIIAAGGTGMIIVGGSVSDAFESVWEPFASILLAVLGAILAVLTAIAAVVAAVLSIFE